MGSRLLWRRSATAVGLYTAVALGIAGTIVAARGFSLVEFGLFATVLAATGFFQSLLDLTVEDSLTKYGFRYVVAEDWGRLRRLFRRALELKLAGGVLAAARAARSRAPGGLDLRGGRARASARGRGRPAARPGAGERRHHCAPPARPLRPPGAVAGVLDGAAPRRDRSRRSARAHGDDRGHRACAGRRDGGGRSRRHRGVSPLPARAGRRARRGSSWNRLVRAPVERSDGHGLAPQRARAAPARHRRRPDAGRPLPDRAGAADRLQRGQRAGPPDSAHRTDARLGARTDRTCPCGCPPLHVDRARARRRARFRSSTGSCRS